MVSVPRVPAVPAVPPVPPVPTVPIMLGVTDLNLCLFPGPLGNLSAPLVRVA